MFTSFGDAAGGLPVEIQTDIGLFQFVEIIVDGDICAALQTIFHKLFYFRQFLLCDLCDIFGDCFAIFVEISIEIICLIVFPFELSILNPVLSKFNCIHLGNKTSLMKNIKARANAKNSFPFRIFC